MRFLILFTFLCSVIPSASANWQQPIIKYYSDHAGQTEHCSFVGKGSGYGDFNYDLGLVEVGLSVKFQATAEFESFTKVTDKHIYLDTLVFPSQIDTTTNIGDVADGFGFGLGGLRINRKTQQIDWIHNLQAYFIKSDFYSRQREKFRLISLKSTAQGVFPAFRQLRVKDGKHPWSAGVAYNLAGKDWLLDKYHSFTNGDIPRALDGLAKHVNTREPMSSSAAKYFATLETILFVVPRFLPAIMESAGTNTLTFYYGERKRGTLPVTFSAAKSLEGKYLRISASGVSASQHEDLRGRQRFSTEYLVNPGNPQDFIIESTSMSISTAIINMKPASGGQFSCRWK